MRKRGPTEQYVLSETQRDALLRVCDNLRDRVMVKMPLFLGLRASEAVHMDRRWIDEEQNLRVPSRMDCWCGECSRRPGRPGVWRPKSKAGTRVLGIPQVLKEDLGPFLVANPKGLGVSRYVLHHQLKRLMRQANIVIHGLGEDSGFPHILRATCATMLAAGGMTAPQLCYHMGWKNLSEADHYIRLATMKSSATKAAINIFGG